MGHNFVVIGKHTPTLMDFTTAAIAAKKTMFISERPQSSIIAH